MLILLIFQQSAINIFVQLRNNISLKPLTLGLIALIAKQNDIHPIPFSSTEISYPGSHQYISKQQNISQKDFLMCSKQISNSQKLLSPLGNLHFLWRFWLYFSGRKFSHVPRLKLKWLNILAELILHPQVT